MKKILNLLLALLMITPLVSATAFASNTVKATVTTSLTYVNGEQSYSTGFNIMGNNYFKLRDLAKNFSGTSSQFNIAWNSKSNAIEILTGQPYTTAHADDSLYYSGNQTYEATLSTSKVLVNGKLQPIAAYTINGNNYFQLRDLADKIPFDIEYNSQFNRISMFSQNPEHSYRVQTAFTAGFNGVLAVFPRNNGTFTSYLVANRDQTVSVINAIENLTIETYSRDYKLVASKSIPLELPLFGSFYSGEKYNYVAYGQENPEENNNKEVIRIVRYDKSFNRIDSVSIKGGESYTIEPFRAGTGRMAEYGDTLVFHTSRKRYTTEDHLNHQSQLTIIVNTSTMTVTNNLDKFQKNHVSHSFDQYVLFDGNDHVLVDHGDAYPRSIVLQKGDGARYTKVDLFNIPGEIGANMTGVSIGGVEMSSANYMVAMNTINHALVKEYTSFEMIGLKTDQRDIILSIVPRTTLTNDAVKHVTLAKYVGTSLIASIPKLVKITDDKMIVLWQEFDMDNNQGDLKYVFIDGDGNPIGNTTTLKNFELSRCNPILVGDQLIWYTNKNNYRMFYSIPLL